MGYEEVDICLEAFLQIISAHLDLGSLSHKAKLALGCSLNGGPWLSLSIEELFPDVESLVNRQILEQPEIKVVFENLKDVIQEAKQIYEGLRAEAQNLESSTKSYAFQEVFIRLCAFQSRVGLPENSAGSRLALQLLENIMSLLEGCEHTIFHSILQNAISLGTPAYPYRTLNHTIKEIRLLVLMPSTESSAMVKCRLIHSNSISNLLYVALSYVWGGSGPPATIELEGRSFTVTPNLYSALKNLRHRSQNRYLWVDAICINQSDIEERNHQVGLMCFIYEQAAAVLMWLGEDEDNSHLAMELLLRLEGNGENWANIIRSAEFKPHLLALRMLIQRNYWSRVWIMQEVLQAKSPFVCCGRYGVLWTTLALLLLVGEAWYHLGIGDVKPYIAVRTTATDGAAALASLWFQKCAGLEIPTLTALMHSRRRQATDLHDYVFGIAGITKGLPITINYNVPVPVLYQQLARNTILQGGSLDILSACYILDPDDCPILNDFRPLLTHICKTQSQTEHKGVLFEMACRTIALGYDNPLFELGPDELPEWTKAGLESLPSWVPRWDHLPAREWDFFHLHPIRSSDDRAAAGLPPRVQFLSIDRELVAEGIFFDVVDVVADFPLELPHIDMENLDSFDCNPFFSRFRDEWDFWVRSTSFGHENPYGLLCDQQKAFRDTAALGYFRQFQKLRDSRDWILNALLGWEPDSAKGMLRGVMEKVVLALCAGLSHRFFITKAGYMGKGKHCIKPGDIVCVLYGGKVPYILRPVNSKNVFLGECYVHGIMDGEAISMRSAGELNEQMFVLI